MISTDQAVPEPFWTPGSAVAGSARRRATAIPVTCSLPGR